MHLRGYSHETRTDGAVVRKRFTGPQAAQRFTTEVSALEALAGLLPVPQIVSAGDGVLQTVHVPGVHGQELMENGHAVEVLRSCATMLRRVQAVDWPGGTLVHGDFGPNNLLLDPDTFEVTAICDWEWAHPGEAIEDLAWTEWIVRRHHPGDVGALAQLFDAYGSEPAWSARKAAMLAICRRMRDRPGNDPGDAAHWQRTITLTTSWTP
ncbi:phosphotransferase [Actinoplanes sp. NPDC023801]|uniref:phosphotransferase family protein n=1 Tax=Actinoplanes sp. NPDC023801 TaxID=3154595 RepID=UPI0033C4BFCF